MSGAPPRSALSENLLGTLDIMLGQPDGLKRIDMTGHAFRWSFMSLLLAALIDISAISAMYDFGALRESASVSKGQLILVKLLSAGIAYGCGMLALYLLCRTPQQELNFLLALLLHNWAAPLVSLFVLPFIFGALAFSPGGEPSVFAFMLTISMIFLLCQAGQRLIRFSLLISSGRAWAFFFATAAVSLLVGEWVESLLMPTPQT